MKRSAAHRKLRLNATLSVAISRPATIGGMSRLRHVSVSIDEPDDGHFHWVLHESAQNASVWIDIASSAEAFPSWMDAFDAGNVALLKLVIDERIGPRAPGANDDAAPGGDVL